MKSHWLAVWSPLALAPLAAAQTPPTWNAAQLEELLPAVGLSAFDEYGRHVAVSGDWAVVGSIRDDWSGTDSGAAYVFKRTGHTWTYFAPLLPQPGAANNAHEANDYFGWSVDIDGTTLVVGEHGDNQGAVDSGAAFVFGWNGSSWVQEAVLKASNLAPSDSFGVSVAIEGDLIVCGANGTDLPGNPGAGSAYVFVRSAPGVWCEQFELSSPGLAANDYFGLSAAVNDEPGVSDDRIAVGAPNKSLSGFRPGAAYVFSRNDLGTPDPCDDVWVQDGGYVLNPGPLADDLFGIDVALESTTLLVGASLDDATGASDCGSISFFDRQVTGSSVSWVLNVQLFPSAPQVNGWLGHDVCLDGDTAVASRHGFDNSIANNGGEALAYARTATSWSEQLSLQPSDRAQGDFSGLGIALDGDTVIVGAHRSDQGGVNSGSAYAFRIARDRFRTFCEGSAGCPCGNDSIVGSAQGCRNSLGRGALLQPSGSTSMADDELLLFASNVPPSVSCILFGSLTKTSTPFYAGLRCVNAPTVRLGLTSSSNTTHAAWNPPIQWLTGGAGANWYLQAWYRDPTFNCAGSPFATTSLTSGVELTLTP